jgi:hypothetical protein
MDMLKLGNHPNKNQKVVYDDKLVALVLDTNKHTPTIESKIQVPVSQVPTLV